MDGLQKGPYYTAQALQAAARYWDEKDADSVRMDPDHGAVCPALLQAVCHAASEAIVSHDSNHRALRAQLCGRIQHDRGVSAGIRAGEICRLIQRLVQLLAHHLAQKRPHCYNVKSHRMFLLFSYSPITSTKIFLVCGPSNSINTISCASPMHSFPSTSDTIV